MKRFQLPALALLVAIATSVAGNAGAEPPPETHGKPAAAADLEQAVAKVQTFYDSSKTFKSDFIQKFWVKAYNQEKLSKGRVTFSKPGKMEWVYDEPIGNRVVSDGTTLHVYEAGNKQAFRQKVDKSQYPAALSFLTGTGKLADNFNFQLFDGKEMNFPGGQVLVGLPKVATPAYQKVLFYVDTRSSQVRRVMVIDGQGNRNRFDFVKPRVNEAVDDTQFVFVPPPNTNIIENK